jgi:hypothetical protein
MARDAEPVYAESLPARLRDREGAAAYLGGVSVDVIDRLIHSGAVPVVRLPVQRSRASGRGVPGVNRRILIDVKDLDALIERSKERFGG